MLTFIQRQDLRIALLKRLDQNAIKTLYYEMDIDPDLGKDRDALLAVLLRLVCHQKQFDELRLMLLDLHPALADEFDFLHAPTVAVAQPERSNPYQGLAAFQEADAARFFGRKAFCQRLKRVVVAQPLTALTGASGSGKSSAVLAGLFPRLREDGYLYGSFRPLTQPFVELRAVLADLLAQQAVAGLTTELAAIEAGDAAALQQVLAALIASREDGLLVLYADQFEELFTLNETRAAAFVALLQAGLAVSEFHLLIGFRADFLPQMIAHFDQRLDAQDQQVLRVLPTMSATDLEEAIVQPAAALGVSFDAALVQRMIAELGEEAGRLPLLQFALTQLWVELAAEQSVLDSLAYDKVGGLTQALVRHADAVYAELAAVYGEAQLRHVFTQLVSPGAGTSDTRRVATAQQVQDWDLVQQLAGSEARLVVTGQHNQMPTVEVVHEALIQHWQPLRAWVAEDREFLTWLDQLRADQVRWDKHQEDALLLQGWVLGEALDKLAVHEDRLSDSDRDFIVRSEAARIAAAENLAKLEQERTRELFESRLTHAVLLAEGEDYARAKQVLKQSAALDADIPLTRQHARNLLAGYVNMMGGAAAQVYAGAGAILTGDVAISPDGRVLAVSGERGTLVLFEVATGALLQRLEGHDPRAGQNGDVWDVVFDAQARLYSAGDDAQIIRWVADDSGHYQQESVWSAPDIVNALALSPDGVWLASGGDDNNISLWHLASGKIQHTLSGHRARISSGGLAFSLDGRWLASASYDDTARVWDMAAVLQQDEAKRHELRGHNANVQSVVFSPDGQYLATSSDDKMILLWDTQTGNPIQVFRGHDNYVFGLVFSPDGSQLASASMDRTLRLWDVASGVSVRRFQGHEAGAAGLTWHKGRLYSASNDSTVRAWAMALPAQQLLDLPSEPNSAALSPDNRAVVVGFADGSLRGYALADGALLWEVLAGHKGDIQGLDFSPDGTLLATAGVDDNLVKLWNMATCPATDAKQPLQTKVCTPEQIRSYDKHTDFVHAVRFSPNGHWLASASYDGQVGLYAVNGDTQAVFEAHEGWAESVAFSADGNYLLSAGYDDKTLKLWNRSTTPPSLQQTLFQAQDNLLWAALSPDAHWAAAVGRGSVVQLIPMPDNPAPARRLIGHEQTVYKAIFSPDSGQLATVSMDATLRLWDVEHAEPLFSVRLPTNVGYLTPLWDFDFQCIKQDCWAAVPLTRGKLALYRFEYEAFPEWE